MLSRHRSNVQSLGRPLKNRILTQTVSHGPSGQPPGEMHRYSLREQSDGKHRQTNYRKVSIVFCHGIWADASCFSKLIPALQADGHEVISVQYGLTSYDHDVAAVKRTMGRVSSPVLLVGHSYGGATITGAASMIASSAWSISRRWHSMSADRAEPAQEDPTDIFGHVEVADGRVWMLPSGVECFAGDLPEAGKKVVWATHYAPDADLFNQQKLDRVPWGSKPNWFIVAQNDRTVHPELQRFLAQRMKAQVTEVPSSHVPMLSKPDVVLGVIRQAAAAVGAK